jgi:hypothetical protein
MFEKTMTANKQIKAEAEIVIRLNGDYALPLVEADASGESIWDNPFVACYLDGYIAGVKVREGELLPVYQVAVKLIDAIDRRDKDETAKLILKLSQLTATPFKWTDGPGSDVA